MNKTKTFALILVAAIVINVFAISGIYNAGYKSGSINGYGLALKDMASLTGVDYQWTIHDDGTYTLKASYGGQSVQVNYKVDVDVELWRAGSLISHDRHAGVLTVIGRDYIIQQISGSASTTVAKYISVSADDASGMTSASTIITNEVDANGVTRAMGTYAHTASTATWTVSKAFSITGTQTDQLYGLNFGATKQCDNNLLCYDTSSAKITITGDTLTVTWTGTQN